MSRSIITDSNFELAVKNKVIVEIWMGDELVEKTTWIVSFTDTVIKVKDGYYLRNNCMVKTSNGNVDNFMRKV